MAGAITNEKELLARTADGDEEAFREFFMEYWDNIYGVAFMFTRSQPMAEDMVQEIFLKIWEKREKLKEVKEFRSYLFIVARNHIFSALRKLKNNESFIRSLADYFDDTVMTPDKVLQKKEVAGIVHAAIERLSPQQREVYRLTREEGLSQEEIAAKLGISKNTVRNHMARALESIREYLRENSSDLLLAICMVQLFL